MKDKKFEEEKKAYLKYFGITKNQIKKLNKEIEELQKPENRFKAYTDWLLPRDISQKLL